METYIYKVKEVIKVIDGDTVDVLIDLGFDLSIKQRVRLDGIDTPEIRTRDKEEKARGLTAKNYLESRLTKYPVDLKIKTRKDKKGKFGRVLADFYSDGCSIVEDLIIHGYGEEYNGGKRK